MAELFVSKHIECVSVEKVEKKTYPQQTNNQHLAELMTNTRSFIATAAHLRARAITN